MLTKSQKAARRRLIAALRSGKYKQAQGALRSGGGFCCQGVQCDLVDPGAWDTVSGSDVFGWREAETYWPEDVRAELGFRCTDTLEIGKLNDGQGGAERHSFEEMAEVLEWLTLADSEPTSEDIQAINSAKRKAATWRRIAARFANGKVWSAGLCWQIDCASHGWERVRRSISPEEQRQMKEQVDSYLDRDLGQQYAYTAPYDRWVCVREDEARCLAALWLAEELEDKARAILGEN